MCKTVARSAGKCSLSDLNGILSQTLEFLCHLTKITNNVVIGLSSCAPHLVIPALVLVTTEIAADKNAAMGRVMRTTIPHRWERHDV